MDKAVAGKKLQNIVPFEIKFATCVHGQEQRVAFYIFEYIRTRFNLVVATFKAAFVSAAVSPLKAHNLHGRSTHIPHHALLSRNGAFRPRHSCEMQTNFSDTFRTASRKRSAAAHNVVFVLGLCEYRAYNRDLHSIDTDTTGGGFLVAADIARMMLRLNSRHQMAD